MFKINGYDKNTGEWNDSLAGDYLWSSVNTREAAPDVMTPFTWSAMRNGFAEMMMLPGYLPVGNICGRIYNNATVGATAFKVLGRKNSFDGSSKELYGIDPNDIGDWQISYIPVGIRDRALVMRNVLRIMSKIRKSFKELEVYLNTNPGWCETQLHDLPNLEKGELIRWSDEVVLPYMIKTFWAMVSPAMMMADVISKLRVELEQVASPEDAIALLSNVSGEHEILASLGIVAGLDRLRRGLISRDEYVTNYGHRGPQEVELSIPRPSENPDWIDEQLDNLQHAPADVDTLMHEQRLRYESALKNLRKSTPKKYDALRKKLQEAARLTRLREAGRSESMRALSVMRAFVLRVGALYGLEEEAFFLEHDEIIEHLKGQTESGAQIPARKTAYQKFNDLPLYPTVIQGRFDPVVWAADPNRRTDIYGAAHQIRKEISDQIKGLPGSAGQAVGRVRILNSVEEGEQLQPGEILVAITTNVGWTTIFPRTAAVITDVGAPLSHAAIVARELGIPAVVGCGDATSVLKTGDLVRVNGSTGTVEILERKSK
ncbi:MAG: PEP-utilizing enzyme [Chloroflexota bacterium]